MNPREILTGCQRDGIDLSLSDDGAIRYAGPEYAVRYWLPILSEHKPELLRELSAKSHAPELESIQSCQDCRHFATPGLSPGYCGQRADLPPAYGINHPLRRLPNDNGESCKEWSPYFI